LYLFVLDSVPSAWALNQTLERRQKISAPILLKLDAGSSSRGFGRNVGARTLQSVFTRTFSMGANSRILRTGRRNGAASISNTSPGSVRTPALNDKVAVPKK